MCMRVCLALMEKKNTKMSTSKKKHIHTRMVTSAACVICSEVRRCFSEALLFQSV